MRPRTPTPPSPSPRPPRKSSWPRLEGIVAEAARKVTDREKDLIQLIEAWEPEFRKQSQGKTAAWMLLEPSAVVSSGGATFKRLDDASWLAGGTNPSNDVYTITSPIKPGAFSGLLLETFPDPSLPNQSLGRYPNGNYVLTGVEAEISATSLESPSQGPLQLGRGRLLAAEL